ncbi:MAG: phytanoyl-CoA dioxygenase family protein [Planctomycetota bacterium]|nr:phytanoyl-CoA dioxygenase family protein [Planctomycetota bacterium]
MTTMTGSDLARQVKPEFDREGYVLIRGFYSPEEMKELSAHLDRFIRDVVPGLPATEVFYEDKARPETIKQMQNMQKYDAGLEKLMLSDRFLGFASGLFGRPAVARGVEWFNKPAKIGAMTPPHQDGYYFMLEPNEALTFWLALEEVDQSNGCIRYIPGSHLTGVRPHARTDVLGFSQGITDFGPDDSANEKCMIVSPGDLLVHHSLCIHRADANKSNRSRRALGMVFYSDRAKADPGKVEAYQKKLMSDLAAKGRI